MIMYKFSLYFMENNLIYFTVKYLKLDNIVVQLHKDYMTK